MLKLERLMNAFPQHLYLSLSPQVCLEAERQSQNYSNDVSRRNAYLNYLCLKVFLAWLADEPDLRSLNPQIYPHREALPSIWEVVNGTAIQLGTPRLVLIPSETISLDEFHVPWEWVDLPSWVGNYYLAVQMNLETDDEDPWMRIWGFATYETLKAGRQDSAQRTYSLARQSLTASLNVMWVEREVFPPSQPVIAPLPSLSPNQAESLISRLGQPTLYSPRLEIPFVRWGAILENEAWRQALYRQRQLAAVDRAAIALKQWLQQANELVESGWQTFESLLLPREPLPVRGGNTQSEADKTTETLTSLIHLLKRTSSVQIRCQAAEMLGEIGTGSEEAVATLVELLQTTDCEETRWQAALSLGKIAPQHPLGGKRRARIIDLDSDRAIALIVAIRPKEDERISVFLQLRPVGKLDKLPPQLQLSVLSSSGETRLQAEARSDRRGHSQDKAIALRFSPPSGTHFQVKVTFGDINAIANFST